MKISFFLLGIFMSVSLFGDKSVVKSVTLNQMEYPQKSFLEVKEIALQRAKTAAAKEIYGEEFVSQSVMVGGKMVDDVLKKSSGGTIRIKGEPLFKNGENFGDIAVTIEAYATDEDIKAAKEEKSLFDEAAAQDKIEGIKRGFYGTWSGFIIKSDSSSSDVMIKISDFGEATISYSAANCGGALIVREKKPTTAKFEQKLTYGFERCEDREFVVLKKIDDAQVLYMLFDAEENELAKGTLYRED